MKLTLGISTLNDGIYGISLPKADPRLEIIIYHQVTCSGTDYLRESEFLIANRLDVSYIKSNAKGLTKSRNAILSLCKTEYLLISDDDVKYYDDFIDTILNNINIDSDLTTFKIMSDDRDFKKYKNKKCKVSYLETAKISSIEMVFNVKKVTNKKISFDESFGLGSKYPCGEEMIIACDILKKGGAICFIPEYIAYHPKISTGELVFSDVNMMEAKRKMFDRAYGNLGCFFSLLFVIKKFNYFFSNKTLMKAIRVLCYGK